MALEPTQPWSDGVPSVDSLFRLEGKTAVVTGGAGFYGKPIVRALAEAGATVVVASRNSEQCEAWAESLRAIDLDVHGMTLDLGDVESIRRLVDDVAARFGKTDILINNAFARMPTHYEEASPAEWENGLRVNIEGVHWCTAAFAKGMRARKSGAIINVASIYGVVAPHFGIYEGEPFASPPDYAFAKGGLIAYTRYCASLFAAEQVRVNCISPGGYYSGQPDSFCKKYNARVPLGRMAEDADIAGPIVFLASDASRYITGANLMVDGGLTIR